MDVSGLTVLGVPASAGAHHAGQDAAPSALRASGLIERMRAAGADVEDGGDLPGEVFTVDHASPGHRNLPAVVRVARIVADAAGQTLRAARIPLMAGGDCIIAPFPGWRRWS